MSELFSEVLANKGTINESYLLGENLKVTFDFRSLFTQILYNDFIEIGNTNCTLCDAFPEEFQTELFRSNIFLDLYFNK